MRSTMRTSGREILNVLIHSAKAPASRVETIPTNAMLVTAWLALAFKPWLAPALAASSASLNAVHVADQRRARGCRLRWRGSRRVPSG